MPVFFTNLVLLEYQVRYLALFRLFSVIDSLEWFWMGALQKKGATLGRTLFPLYVNDLPDNIIYNIAIFVDETSLYSKCD